MKICVIHSGGTIGMTKTSRGYATKKGYFAAKLQNFPPLKKAGMPQFHLIELPVILDSSNVSLSQWNEIGSVIFQNYNDYDGFVILHGTDTLCYTASALSFMFEELGKPIILTGSQIPFCEENSDAGDNLVSSFRLAADKNIKEVCVCFGGMLLRGNRATKVSADSLAAFDSPNFPPLAKWKNEGIIRINKKKLLKNNGGTFSFFPFEFFPIAVLKVFPGIQFDIFENILKPQLKGIVLEAFGSGNVPQGDNGLTRLLAKAKDNKTAIVIVTQCLEGNVRLGVYEASSSLKDFDAISGFDMTAECAVCKLYHLLSQGFSGKDLADMMEKNLRGEITTI